MEFTTSERLEIIKIDKIQPNESLKENLAMEKNQTDGFHWLTFRRSDGKPEIQRRWILYKWSTIRQMGKI